VAPCHFLPTGDPRRFSDDGGGETTKSFVSSVRPRGHAAFARPAFPAGLPGRHADRFGAHHVGEPRVFRLRNAATLRHREAPCKVRVSLALFAPGSRRERFAGVPTLPLVDDAGPTTTTGVASPARTTHRLRRARHPGAIGCRAGVRRQGRHARDAGVSALRRDRRGVHGARHPHRQATRLRVAPPRDAARRRSDERRG